MSIRVSNIWVGLSLLLATFMLSGCLGGEEDGGGYDGTSFSGGGDLGVNADYPTTGFNALSIQDIPLGEKNEIVVNIFDASELVDSPFQDSYYIAPVFSDIFLASDNSIEIFDLPTDRPLLIMLLTRNDAREVTYVGQMTKRLKPGELTLVTVPMKQFGVFLQDALNIVYTDNSGYYVDDEIEFEFKFFNSTLFNLGSLSIDLRSLTSGARVTSYSQYSYNDFLPFTSKTFDGFKVSLDDEFSGPIDFKATITFSDNAGNDSSYEWEQIFTLEDY
ncbi:MAG: hypothetical protein COV44_11850 [Deltaproteobacteria bacterium CG11_big_fil_rev_8_21_14_0_20_45_16]|nr:MAG: hypothetical protein COV44_11850 [Deltaproteobacteria bacterium CG11_big_fil_rev_8_21_14_0_20_45_16]